MDLTAFSVIVIIILFPGIIASNLFGILNVQHSKRSEFRYVIDGLLFGITSYMLLQAGSLIFSKELLKVFELLDTSNANICFDRIPFVRTLFTEILLASILAFFLAIVFSYLNNRKVFERISRKKRLINNYGEQTLYSSFFEINDVIKVYHKPTRKNYQGILKGNKDFDGTTEIVLEIIKTKNVSANNSATKFNGNHLYMCFDKKDVVIKVNK